MTDSVMVLADLAQLTTGCLATGAYLPQISKLYKVKSSQGVSVATWVMWTISGLLALFYSVVYLAVQGVGVPLVVTATANFACSFATLILVLRYRASGNEVTDVEEDLRAGVADRE